MGVKGRVKKVQRPRSDCRSVWLTVLQRVSGRCKQPGEGTLNQCMVNKCDQCGLLFTLIYRRIIPGEGGCPQGQDNSGLIGLIHDNRIQCCSCIGSTPSVINLHNYD